MFAISPQRRRLVAPHETSFGGKRHGVIQK